jgi:hypothetical protein
MGGIFSSGGFTPGGQMADVLNPAAVGKQNFPLRAALRVELSDAQCFDGSPSRFVYWCEAADKAERCVDLVLDHSGTTQQRKDGTDDALGGLVPGGKMMISPVKFLKRVKLILPKA